MFNFHLFVSSVNCSSPFEDFSTKEKYLLFLIWFVIYIRLCLNKILYLYSLKVGSLPVFIGLWGISTSTESDISVMDNILTTIKLSSLTWTFASLSDISFCTNKYITRNYTNIFIIIQFFQTQNVLFITKHGHCKWNFECIVHIK